MSQIENALKAASDKLYEKFCAGLAKIDPTTATMCALAATSAVGLVGFGMEVVHQSELLSAAGPKALEAYRALTPDSTLRYLGQALSGDLPSTGQNIQGRAVWMGMTVPALTLVAAKLAKGFANLKGMTEEPTAPLPRGATRVEQMNSALSSISASLDKPAAMHEATPSTKPRGLS